jgi:hypothetical protein
MSRKIVRVAPIPLSCIRGADIGAAQRSLPPCGPASPEAMTAEVDAEDIGRVRIAFRKTQAKRHRTASWFWVAELADLVSTHVCDRRGRPTVRRASVAGCSTMATGNDAKRQANLIAR